MESKTEQHIETSDEHGKKVEHHHTETHTKQPTHAEHGKVEQKFKLREVIIFLLVLGLGMAGAWGINRAMQHNKDKTAEAPNSNNKIELPSYGTPEASNPPAQNEATGDAMSRPATSETSAPSPAPRVAVKVQYKNNTHGFMYDLPAGWAQAVEESSTREIVFYDQLHAGVISSIEVYENAGSETLDSLVVQLSRSQSVHNVRKIVINGHEWVEFDSTSGSFNRGIATVHSGRVYYINGELSKPEFAQHLRFQ
jgi:hypothetical protein